MKPQHQRIPKVHPFQIDLSLLSSSVHINHLHQQSLAENQASRTKQFATLDNPNDSLGTLLAGVFNAEKKRIN